MKELIEKKLVELDAQKVHWEKAAEQARANSFACQGAIMEFNKVLEELAEAEKKGIKDPVPAILKKSK